MNFKYLFIILCVVCRISADDWDNVDLSLVGDVQDRPGFWDDKAPELIPLQVDPRLRSSRIVGGWEVKPHSHPYVVFMLSTNGPSTWRCSGSIISPTAILTAAQCPDGSTSTLVISGVHNVNTIEETQQRRRVSSYDYKIHENYNPQNFHNDIAILLIRSYPFTETREVAFVQLPYGYKNELFIGKMVSIVGWGRTCTLCQTSSVLRGSENYVIANEACLPYHNSFVDHQMCIRTEGARGACFGDSGGPYTLSRSGPSDHQVVTQIGIHSFIATGGCEADRPSGSIRLTYFLDWIDSKLKL
ncbi:brachyurin-like [Chironomus tepperi]|uniref:brachyurin-like n=1 Tax=Chironomus tepperi TaxID=113505 RepID=UPI00391F12F4